MTLFHNKLKIALLYDNVRPRFGNPLTSQPVSKSIDQILPVKGGELYSDAYIFFLDEVNQTVNSYSNVTGEVKTLFSIVKETDTMVNKYFKLDVVPKGAGGLYDTYRFLIATEIDRQFNMCFLFTYDLKKNKISEPVKQFMGIDCIYIGA